MSQKLSIGIDVGGTNTKIAVVTADGNIIQKISVPTLTGKKADVLIDCLIQNTKQLINVSGLSQHDIHSVGLGIPGTVNVEKGAVVYAPNIFLKNVEIINRLKKSLQKRIFISQDSRASAWAEYLIGVKKQYSNIVSITLGTGIGCGMIIDGKIFTGALNTAGEFGHQIIDVNGRNCHCGKRGCLETLIGGPAILKEALSVKKLKKKLNADGSGASVSRVYDLALKGDKDALLITKYVVRYLAQGLVNLINIISPQFISISGGISGAGDKLLLNPLKKQVKELAYGPVSNKIKIVKSTLGPDAPVIGAALMYQCI